MEAQKPKTPPLEWATDPATFRHTATADKKELYRIIETGGSATLYRLAATGHTAMKTLPQFSMQTLKDLAATDHRRRNK